MTAIHWTKIEIVDGDNAPITGPASIYHLTTFKNDQQMGGAFFVNTDTSEPGDWDYVPEIDWTDFPNAGTTDLF